MRVLKRLSILLFTLGTLALGCQSAQEQHTATNDSDSVRSDPKALAVVEEMWQALGGKETWQQTGYLGFRWIVERDGQVLGDFRHDWDRKNNRYRVEGVSRDGQHFVALFDTETRDGEVYVDGAPVQVDSTRKKWLERAYARYINETYWLLMPYKLNDPGVILAYEGEREVNGRTYDVLKVTFDNVGLTPGDTYWAFVDREDRLMHKWEYKLESHKPEQPATVTWWEDWRAFDGIKLALNRRFENRPVRISFKEVRVAPEAEDAIFSASERTFWPD